MALLTRFKDDLTLLVLSDAVPTERVMDQLSRNGQLFCGIPALAKPGFERRVYCEVVPHGDEYITDFLVAEREKGSDCKFFRVNVPTSGFYVAKLGDPMTLDAELDRNIRYMRDHIVSDMMPVSLPKRVLNIRPVESKMADGSLELCVEAAPERIADVIPEEFFGGLDLSNIERMSTVEAYKRLWESIFLGLADYAPVSGDKNGPFILRRLQHGLSCLYTMLHYAVRQGRYKPDTMVDDQGRSVRDVLSTIFLGVDFGHTLKSLIEEFRSVEHLPDAGEICRQYIWLKDVKTLD